MPDFIRQGASVTASVLESAAGQLRKLSDADEQEQTEPSASPAEAEAEAEAAPRKRPAAGTRSRIANPKAAKKVRAREG